MNILITMKLADRSLKYHILPLTLLSEIDKIILVRDKKGPLLDKVEYYCPPNCMLKIPILALFYKFILMLILSVVEKPAIVHSYLLFPHGILGFIVAKLTNRKCGVSLIAGPMELYELWGDPINKYSYCKPLPKLTVLGRIQLRIINACDLITVTGSFSKNFLMHKGIDKNKIFILPHILDDKFNIQNIIKEYDLIYVGRLIAMKHIDTIIKAVSVIKKYNPNIKVVIVGDGECKVELEKLTNMLDLTDNINFVGYQSDVWYWYNKSKISILTSEREGFPYSVLESLNCGLPVIVSNCGDICDVIEDDYNGTIVDDYQDYNLFAEAIIRLLKDPILIKNYSANAFKTSNKINVNKVALIWKKILYNI